MKREQKVEPRETEGSYRRWKKEREEQGRGGSHGRSREERRFSQERSRESLESRDRRDGSRERSRDKRDRSRDRRDRRSHERVREGEQGRGWRDDEDVREVQREGDFSNWSTATVKVDRREEEPSTR